MPTQAKRDEVARLKERFERAAAVVLVDYRGLTADQMVELRAGFTRQGVEFTVVKNTLARLAAKDASLDDLAGMFDGPIGVAISYADPAAAFKLSDQCRRKYDPFYRLKGGLFDKEIVAVDEVERYVNLPSREESLAKLVMLLASPMRALAVVLQAKIRELASVLNEVRKLREQQNKEE